MSIDFSQFRAKPIRRRFTKETEPRWKTKDGTVMLMSQMEDSHLINAIKMVMRKIYKEYKDNFDLSGDKLVEFIEYNPLRTFGIKDLLNEAKSRKSIDCSMFGSYARSLSAREEVNDKESVKRWASRLLDLLND
jgi:hypothetical protein